MQMDHATCQVGTHAVATSAYEPFKDYIVLGKWIDSLWSSHKLTHEQYLDYARLGVTTPVLSHLFCSPAACWSHTDTHPHSTHAELLLGCACPALRLKVRLGYVTRKRAVEAVQQQEAVAALRREQAEVLAALQPLQKPFLPEVVAQVKDWAQQYQVLDSRYKFLVLRAPSRAGKNTLAKSLHLLMPELIPKPLFVQTVQSAAAADLQQYNRQSHGFLLFDNCNSMDFVLSQRALFQANPDFHRLGQSQTNVFSYEVYLFRAPIVVTIDESAAWDDTEPWIRENQHLIALGGPCYQMMQ